MRAMVFVFWACVLLVLSLPSSGGADDARQITTGTDNDIAPSWSPDSDQIAFARGPVGEQQIWTIPATGGTPTQITSGPDYAVSPSWSPDGSLIAFRSSFQIWVIPAAGGVPRQITYLGTNEEPDWSPDGSQLAVTSYRGTRSDIWIVPVAAGVESQVTNHPTLDWDPAWSPDGTQIAFTSNRSGNADIWVIPVRGGTAKQLTSHHGSDAAPAWSPDGSQIVFVRDRRFLLAIPSTGGPEKHIMKDNTGRLFRPAWSPDGALIVYDSGPWGGHALWVIPAPTTDGAGSACGSPLHMNGWKTEAHKHVKGLNNTIHTFSEMNVTFPQYILDHFYAGTPSIDVEGASHDGFGGPLHVSLIYDTLTQPPGEGAFIQAKKELLALLLNVTSHRLATSTVVSVDMRTVSEAIQHMAANLNTMDPDLHEAARWLGNRINTGACSIASGTIDPDDIYDVIAYKPIALVGTEFLHAGPTPTRGPTMLSFNLAQRQHVTVQVYSVAGRLVQELVVGSRPAGRHSVLWHGYDRHGRSVPEGVYFLKAQIGQRCYTQRVVRLR